MGLRPVTFVPMLLCLSACSVFVDSKVNPINDPSPAASAPISSALESIADSEQEQLQPLSFEVIQESNDGDLISVTVRVDAKVAWATDQALVKLSGVDGERQVAVDKKLLSDGPQGQLESVPNVISPGDPKRYRLSIPAAGVSAYSVELLWGQDATVEMAEEMTRRSRVIHPFLLKVESVTVEEHTTTQVKVIAELVNQGENVVDQASVGFGWRAQGRFALESVLPQNERVVVLRGLRLRQGEKRKLAVTLAKPDSDTGFEPAIRIIAVE